MLTQIQMVIEIILSFFLLLGIIYSLYFSRVLSNLKRDRASLLGLVEKLESSVKRAEEGVDKLRIAGEVSGRPLSRAIEQAKLAGADLDTMTSKAEVMADRLQALATRIPVQERQFETLIEKIEAARQELLQEAESIRYPDCQPDSPTPPSRTQAEPADMGEQPKADQPGPVADAQADAVAAGLGPQDTGEQDTGAQDPGTQEDKPAPPPRRKRGLKPTWHT
jgi:Domain of unknown function (DUF6468)